MSNYELGESELTDQIWPYLQHPLVVVGLLLMLFFAVHKALLRSGVLPPLDRRTGGKIVHVMLRYGFIIALAVVLLGFAVQLLKTYLEGQPGANRGELRDLKTDVNKLQSDLTETLKHLRSEPVSAMLRVSILSEEDRKRLEANIANLKQALETTGQGTAENYYLLGVGYLRLGDYDNAKAYLLQATNLDPKYGRANIALASVHQLEANDSLRADNFGRAEQQLKSAEGYLKTAQQLDATDPDAYTQLGYIYKDFAQRSLGLGRQAKADGYLSSAEQMFKMALSVNDKDYNAWNGLGNVALLRGDYDQAIANSQKAIQLLPRYIFAHYDLAISYSQKAKIAKAPKQRADALKGLMKSAGDALELQRSGKGFGRLPEAAVTQLEKASQWASAELAREK